MRRVHQAEVLSIGSELTTGETGDTNARELAAELTSLGIVVRRLGGLADVLADVHEAIGTALSRSDVVVMTGGLGPTPDDLTRESIAAALGEEPTVDPALEAWLRGLFERRSMPIPEANLKQAWLIPSATSIPNERGTAPGWWVEAPEGRVIVALPGPPHEMLPMWHDWVRPRLLERGFGRESAAVTLRTTGLGESLVAERLGSLLDRGARPTVATYARAAGVDVRISADADEPGGAALVEATEIRVKSLLDGHVWARGDTTWAGAIAEALEARGRTLAVVEVGLRGALVGLLGEGLGERLAFAETLSERPSGHDGHAADVPHLAARVRELGRADVGLAVEARPRRGDTAVSVAIVDPDGTHRERRLVFLAGDQGRSRAALAAAAILLTRLRAGA